MLKRYRPLIVVLALAGCLLARAEEPKKIDVVGTVAAGVMAIGGETTGYTIRNDRGTWELDFGSHAEWRKLADELDGKQAHAKGVLVLKEGVEIGQRRIIQVEQFEKVQDQPK